MRDRERGGGGEREGGRGSRGMKDVILSRREKSKLHMVTKIEREGGNRGKGYYDPDCDTREL